MFANRYYQRKVDQKLQQIQSQHQQELKQEKQNIETQLDNQQQQIEDLKFKLQSRIEKKQQEAAMALIEPPKTPEPPKPVQTTPLTQADAKSFIYMRESGNNPLARNAGGCLGLGQACPGSKLLAICPSLDYACEDQFFTNYMLNRYGSWENARAWWQAHNWW